MNLLKKITELASMRLSILSSRQIKVDISRSDWINFGLTMLICFMIIIYKVNKSA